MQRYLMASTDIFQIIKYNARKKWLARLGKNGEASMDKAMELWWNPESRMRMKAFVDYLSTKNKV